MDRGARLGAYAKAFITDKGTIFTNLATAKAVKLLPDVVAIMQREAERVLALLQRLRAAESARSDAGAAHAGP